VNPYVYVGVGAACVTGLLALLIICYFSLKRASTQYGDLKGEFNLLSVQVNGIDVEYLKKLLSRVAFLEIELQKRDTQIQMLDDKITAFQNRAAGRKRWEKKGEDDQPEPPPPPELLAEQPAAVATNGSEPQWVRSSRVANRRS